MTEFGDGKYDILLSTNIVESGLDMPAVNTLIIHRADMFGLGQLYQLRGRVGRGKQRGYAYLTWPPNHRLSAAAEKRLDRDADAGYAGRRLHAGLARSGYSRRRQSAGRRAIRPYPRSRHRAVSADAGRRGRRHARREGRAESRGPRLDAEHQSRPARADPGTYVRDLPVRLGLYRRIGALASTPRARRWPPNWSTASASCRRKSKTCCRSSR
jgi:transcription-repair coupling factor (superfamily II helicase)